MAAKDPAEREKWKKAQEKAQKTATWAKTMTRVVISQNNSQPPFWHVINFLGKSKCEPRGIVDLLAIRKNQGSHSAPLKRGDLFDIVIIQVKGGSARRPSIEDRERLRKVRDQYCAKAILLSEWKKGSKAVFHKLRDDVDDWEEGIDPAEIFGKKSTSRKLPAKGVRQRLSESAGAEKRSAAAKKAWASRKAEK